jgi:hypothetical protein
MTAESYKKHLKSRPITRLGRSTSSPWALNVFISNAFASGC